MEKSQQQQRQMQAKSEKNYWCHLCRKMECKVIYLDKQCEQLCSTCQSVCEEDDQINNPQNFVVYTGQENQHPNLSHQQSINQQPLNGMNQIHAALQNIIEGQNSINRQSSQRVPVIVYQHIIRQPLSETSLNSNQIFRNRFNLTGNLNSILGLNSNTNDINSASDDQSDDDNDILNLFSGLRQPRNTSLLPFLDSLFPLHRQLNYDRLIQEFLANDPNNYGPQPAPTENIQSLKQYKATGELCQKNCTICQDNYTEEQQVNELPCNHIFHKTCVEQWLSRHNSCPVCRKPI